MTSPITLLPAEAQAQIRSSSKIVTLNDVVAGLLRNALDSGASKVTIDVNYRRRSCTVEDNGLGIPAAEFRSDGGLGKLHYTSKHDSLDAIHGRDGVFLSSLAALSLLTITSRHHHHRSYNSLTLHQSAVIARHLPALSHQEVSFWSHGTRVTVRDLFGNMPVRIKYLALASERQGAISNEWRALKKDVLALLLAWGREVNVMMRDAERDKKFVLRWPSSEETFSHCVNRLQASPITSVALTQSLFSQALRLPTRLHDSWISVSASGSSLTIDGAISLEPVPTRHFQFIAFGIEPLTSDNEYNTLFHTINNLFATSSFGDLEDEDVPSEDNKHKPAYSGHDGNGRSGKHAGNKGKGIDRWPIFFLRVSPRDEKALSGFDAAQLGVNSNLTLAVLELLQVTITQFLRASGFELRQPRARAEAKPSPPAGDGTAESSNLLSKRQNPQEPAVVGPASGSRLGDRKSESYKPHSHQATGKTVRRSNSGFQRREFQMDELGGGVTLPSFRGDPSYHMSSESSAWSKVKSSKRDEYSSICPRGAAKSAPTDAVTRHAKGAVKKPSQVKPSASNEQSVAEGHADEEIESSGGVINQEPWTPKTQSPPTTTETEQVDAMSDNQRGTDEEGICMHPKTMVAVHYNSRTGNVVPQIEGRSRLSSSSSSGRSLTSHPLKTGVDEQSSQSPSMRRRASVLESSTWFQNVLAGWENPIFCPTERPILQVRSGCLSLVEPASSRPASCRGSSFLKVRSSEAELDLSQSYRLSKTALRDAKVIAQFDGKFILVKVADCRDQDGGSASDCFRREALVAIDQHAADERCRIENLFSELCTEAPAEDGFISSAGHHSRIKTAVLDTRIKFDVDESEAKLLEGSAAYFARWGILYDLSAPLSRFAGCNERTVSVKTIPPGIVERCKGEPKLLIELLRREIWERDDICLDHPAASSNAVSPVVDDLADVGSEPMGLGEKDDHWLGQLNDCPRTMLEMLNSRACRSAIMFNDQLSVDECEGLVSRLAQCVLPFQCAHGRPTMFPIVDMDLGSGSLMHASDAEDAPFTRTTTRDSVQDESLQEHGDVCVQSDDVRPGDGFITAFRQWKS